MDKQAFFSVIRESLFSGTLKQSHVDGIETILNEIESSGIGFGRRAAYVLATTLHETARTMQPIEEYGKGKGRTYGYNLKRDGKKYYDTTNIFYGRGYVQLTWYENYWSVGQKLGHNFIENPALVMQPDIAAKILVRGMIDGWFTGRRLSNYFTATTTDYVNARRIINGTDRAELIAGYALKFKAAIEAAQ